MQCSSQNALLTIMPPWSQRLFSTLINCCSGKQTNIIPDRATVFFCLVCTFEPGLNLNISETFGLRLNERHRFCLHNLQPQFDDSLSLSSVDKTPLSSQLTGYLAINADCQTHRVLYRANCTLFLLLLLPTKSELGLVWVETTYFKLKNMIAVFHDVCKGLTIVYLLLLGSMYIR